MAPRVRVQKLALKWLSGKVASGAAESACPEATACCSAMCAFLCGRARGRLLLNHSANDEGRPLLQRAQQPSMPARRLSSTSRLSLKRNFAGGSMATLAASFGGIAPELAVILLDVVEDDLLEVLGKRRAAQGHGLAAIDEHRSRRLLARSGQRDADI